MRGFVLAVAAAAAAAVAASEARGQGADSLATPAAPPAHTARPPARTVILPYLGSAPETGVQYGATIFRVRQPADSGTRPSSAQLFANYTAKSQARAFLEVDRWTAGNRWRTTARVEWQRFPLPYYGFGDAAPASAEELYTPRGVLALATVQRRVRGALYAFGGYRYQDVDVVQTADTGVLRRGAVVGSEGGRVGQLQGGALWDSRDNVFAPYRGAFVQVTGSAAAAAFGSEFDFRRVVVDARRFLALGEGRVVAVQGVVETTGGAAPFDQVSLVGNSNYLRGYTRGRFRDRHLAAVQAEYRAPLAGRLGWAAFAGGGRVTSRVGDLVGGGARVLPSYGLGARWLLFASSRSTVRVDYARGADGQSGLYVALNEAF
jgi:outer membrane protein assembly factor BamA